MEIVKIMKNKKLVGRTLNIKIRDSEFNTITRSVTQSVSFKLEAGSIVSVAQTIFDENMNTAFSIRLLGISLSNLQSSGFEEITLF